MWRNLQKQQLSSFWFLEWDCKWCGIVKWKLVCENICDTRLEKEKTVGLIVKTSYSDVFIRWSYWVWHCQTRSKCPWGEIRKRVLLITILKTLFVHILFDKWGKPGLLHRIYEEKPSPGLVFHNDRWWQVANLQTHHFRYEYPPQSNERNVGEWEDARVATSSLWRKTTKLMWSAKLIMVI